jgi:hypothetical protein
MSSLRAGEREGKMIKGRKIAIGGLLLLIGSLIACGPVHQTVRPDGNSLIGAAVASAHNTSLDYELAKSIGAQMDGFSCRSVFKDSLRKTLVDSKRFSDIQVFDKNLDPVEVSRYDAVLTFLIPNWGIRLVERGQNELLATFVELEAKMVPSASTNILWDEHDTVIGQIKRTMGSYQNDKELLRKDIHETVVDAGQRMANILIYR